MSDTFERVRDHDMTEKSVPKRSKRAKKSRKNKNKVSSLFGDKKAQIKQCLI